jgi:type II secretory pathway pseudopilin PulG
MRRRRDRRGVVLLEALLALAIVSAAVVMTLTLQRADGARLARALDRQSTTRSANRLLRAVSLWPRTDLDRRLGTRRQGPFWLEIQRPSPVRYDVQLLEAETGRLLLLTSLFRPEDDSVQP